ncbi:hypothetical protein FPC840_260013 [Flavobacterium psychrophilum]|nr:hypothetical protein FPC840_260013 [Flavobacterium psychrophilum]
MIRRYNIWYNKTSISMLLIALFSAYNFYKVNKYNTLSAIKNLQLYNSDNKRLARLRIL